MLNGIPSRVEASNIARAAGLSDGGTEVKSQATAAFRAALASGTAKEVDGTMTVDIELNVNRRPLYPPGKMITDIDIQSWIHEGWDAFATAMKAEGYQVKDTSDPHGGYAKKTASITWSTGAC
jgi:hypothetical protein